MLDKIIEVLSDSFYIFPFALILAIVLVYRKSTAFESMSKFIGKTFFIAFLISIMLSWIFVEITTYFNL